MEEGPIIVFDGECVLCSASAQFVLRHDRRGRFRLATAQSDFGRQAYRRHGLDADAMTTMIVLTEGRALTESDAVLAVLEGLGWPWRLAGAARIIPHGLRDRLYGLVARNRYRWIGKRPTCWRPTADVASRVL